MKIRGFRIELGEIEHALAAHSSVKNCVVVAREDTEDHKRLVAYIVPAGDRPVTRELRDFLESRLPEYMIPSAFVVLAALPLTPNGKIDQRSCPHPPEKTRHWTAFSLAAQQFREEPGPHLGSRIENQAYRCNRQYF